MELSRDSILKAVSGQPDRFDNKALARQLGVKGEDRRVLRQLLREMVEEGVLKKSKSKTFREADDLPGVMVIKVTHIDDEGDMVGVPEIWKQDSPPPTLIVREGPISKKAKGHNAATVGVGGRALCRIKKQNGLLIAQVMKKLGDGPSKHLGILFQGGRGWRIQPVNKKTRHDYKPSKVPDGAQENDLVVFQSSRRNQGDVRLAEILETIGTANNAKAASLISLHENEIPMGFDDEVIEQAKALSLPALSKTREDLRDLPLLTIDPVDAKDFDDAVYAKPLKGGGWEVWVAIADVSAFVTPGSALDSSAEKKGNSVYLPDRVEPMLPHELSSDLCSLRPHEDRACLAVCMKFDKAGIKQSHRFHRAIMRSHARLTYAQAQEAFKGEPGEAALPVEDILKDIYAAYKTLRKARNERAPLAIELPERRVHVNDEGEVTKITVRERFDAHKLVEEFMVQANVAAAEALSEKNVTTIVRVHEPPSGEKLQGLTDYLPALGLKFSMGERTTTKRLNRLLEQAAEKDLAETVGMAVLRSQSQAVYDPEPKGHFGLNLIHYAHFTSPIRRYADLVVHRALISAFGLGDDGTTEREASRLKEIAEHISSTERRAMSAERDAKDRYIAAYLQDRIGAVFDARLTGVTKFGLFITLDETGADGLIPTRSLGREYFVFDERRKALIGSETGGTFRFGRQVKVKLVEATPVTGGLVFEMLSKPEPGKKPKRASYNAQKSRGSKHRRRRR